MFPGQPSPGDNIILIKDTFDPELRLGVLSKAPVPFNSLKNWFQFHPCWPLGQIIFNVLYPYDHLISSPF